MRDMVDSLADKVYKTLNYFLQQYYSSYNPVVYERSKDLLYSAVKVDAKIVGDIVEARVYIDYEALDDYTDATGYQVVSWANQGLHGGMKLGKRTPEIWDDTIDATVNSGELIKEAVKYLRSKGFTVSNN